MIQRSEYGEGNPERICCYCGAWADTVDHVPSKVLLDEPYPDNLPVVPCCKKCNEQFSHDEEYFAVLLECVRWQTFNQDEFKREKARKIVKHNPAILKKARESVHPLLDGRFTIELDNMRLRKVLTKLIAGHLRFEGLDQLFLHDGFEIQLLQDIHSNREFYKEFHSPLFSELLPEVGSRALFSMIESGCVGAPWFLVQPGMYEYCVAPDNSEVRIIIQNYFGIRGQKINTSVQQLATSYYEDYS